MALFCRAAKGVHRLASENHGISHFTTTPDSNFNLLYINDLVRALKSNTLEVIASDAGSVGAGTPKDISFPVNATSRSITEVLSWSGASQVNAVAAQMHGPGGAALTFTLLSHSPAVPGASRLRATRRRL